MNAPKLVQRCWPRRKPNESFGRCAIDRMRDRLEPRRALRMPGPRVMFEASIVESDRGPEHRLPSPSGCDSFGSVKGPSAEAGFVAVADEAHLRRERARARELRASPWWKRRRSDGTCHYCGGRFEPAALTMDHVVPLVRGGRSTRGNVVPACKDCNNEKKHALPWEREGHA
jgi:5-methylcytosine-specific restriction enzyme A